MTKYGQKCSFGAINCILMCPVGGFVNQKGLMWQHWPFLSFCESERLDRAMLGISENLRTRGQRPSSPNDHIWAKNAVFGSITAFSAQGGNFCQWKNLPGTVLSIFELLRFKG